MFHAHIVAPFRGCVEPPRHNSPGPTPSALRLPRVVGQKTPETAADRFEENSASHDYEFFRTSPPARSNRLRNVHWTTARSTVSPRYHACFIVTDHLAVGPNEVDDLLLGRRRQVQPSAAEPADRPGREREVGRIPAPG